MKCPKCGAENLSWRYRCLECGETLHPEYDKLPSFKSSNPFRLLPFILGLLGTVVLAFFVIFEEKSATIFFYGLLAVAVAGLAVCWKWPRVGGVLLILTSLFPIASMLIGGILSSEILFTLIIRIPATLPLLASGILLIIFPVRQ
jgi:hypothetical protein